jgi:hypothetical protein
MVKTIKRLAAHISEAAIEIGAEADKANHDCIGVAEAALSLRDDQRAMNAARDAIRRAANPASKASDGEAS